MKFTNSIVVAFSLFGLASALVPNALPHQVRRTQQQRTPFVASLRMTESDFSSAMPAKPEMSVQERLQESATTFIADLGARLAEGVEAPPEVAALKEARDSGADPSVLATRIYELMIEQGMLYDIDAENGTLSPTQFDIKNNLDVPEVKKEFLYLYNYGMSLIDNGMIELEAAKKIIKARLIDRTGLTPEEFDAWLGY